MKKVHLVIRRSKSRWRRKNKFPPPPLVGVALTDSAKGPPSWSLEAIERGLLIRITSLIVSPPGRRQRLIRSTVAGLL